MLSKNIENFIGCDKSYDEAKFVLFGAPFDSTVSYRPGARFGSRAARSESYAVETYSPYLDMDMAEIDVFDAGDLELCIGETKTALEQIESFVSKILSDGKYPAMIGGEHLTTLPVIRAMHKKYPELCVIHFDAHADLRDEYLGAKLSHATVMRRVWDELGDGRIYQFGIRSGDKSEFLWSIGRSRMQKFNFDGLERVVGLLKGKPVYFTLDFDALDPSVFPGTGTPEAGGVSFNELLSAIYLLSEANIVGFDAVELSPVYDPGGASVAAACKLIREILLTINYKKEEKYKNG